MLLSEHFTFNELFYGFEFKTHVLKFVKPLHLTSVSQPVDL